MRKNRYYIDYPRNFANEYNVFVVSAEDESKFEQAYPKAQRITRKRAIELGWTRTKEAGKNGEEWCGSFCSLGRTAPKNIADAIASCLADTKIMLKETLEGGL